jgi:hypothetical protein
MWYRYAQTSKDLYYNSVNEKVRQKSLENNWDIPVGLRKPEPGFSPSDRTDFADQLENQFSNLHEQHGGEEGAKSAMIEYLKKSKEDIKKINPYALEPGNPQYSRSFYLLPDGKTTAAVGNHAMIDRDLLSEFNINPHFIEDGERATAYLTGAITLLLDTPGVFRAELNYAPTPAQSAWLSQHMKPGAEPFVGSVSGLNVEENRFEQFLTADQILKKKHKMIPQSQAIPSLKSLRPGLYK